MENYAKYKLIDFWNNYYLLSLVGDYSQTRWLRLFKNGRRHLEWFTTHNDRHISSCYCYSQKGENVMHFSTDYDFKIGELK
jgi:hypothetical protein